jgi:NADPH:quinone reductase-like Zn-dependent oxidoreductase/NAD(P)-dependent dehydrogenase (short-subunit alcohol dehydrogenase family)/acyl carrier protein
LYERLSRHGYDYGPTFQGLRVAWRLGDDIYAEISLPDEDEADDFSIHPALLDAALHAIGAAADATGTGRRLRLPFAWTGVALHAVGATALRVRLTPTGEDTFRLTAADPTGAPVISAEALTLRPVSLDRLEASTHPDSLFRLDWAPVRPATSASEPSDWASLGHAWAGGADYADIAALTKVLAPGAQVPGVVVAASMSPQPRDTAAQASEAAGEALRLLQDWLACDPLANSVLVMLTSGAVAARAGDQVTDLAAAAVWGMLRSAQAENPGRFVLVDLDAAEESRSAVPDALASGEPQLAIRDGQAFAVRLTRASSEARLSLPAGNAAWRLDFPAKGSLDGMVLTACPEVERELGSTEVRVAVRAVALNFRDVLIALGLYPEDALIGGEIAGIVQEVGSDVTGFAPGDRVMGLSQGGIGPVAIADHHGLAPIPEGWSFTEAATVPVGFLTAYHGLRDVADLRPGESLLVHAATGGVGMAALQLAGHWSVQVYGTASPAKWEALRAAGIRGDQIASSRALGFEQHFLDATRGRGVDVVLNSLTGEFTDASLRLMPRGGRFVELGKTDIRDARRIMEEHPGVRYQAVDISQVERQRIKEMLADLSGLFATGALRPLPAKAWDVRDAPDAFRYLSQARHVGKVVLTVPVPAEFDPDGTVLITGGTGTLGAHIARHLATTHHIRHLLLISRHGPDAPGATTLAADLTTAGARPVITACDAADPHALAALLDTLPRPLTAVIHAAGTLADATLTHLTPSHLTQVLRPKADAAWNLHHQTRNHPLRAFILFSSLAATIGSPGQANYAAANAYLDALAHHRHAHGLPATSIAWGLWQDTSTMTSHLTHTDHQRITRTGTSPLTTPQALTHFDTATTTPHPHAIATHLNPATLHTQATTTTLPPILSNLVRVPVTRTPADTAASFVARLTTLPAADRSAVILDLVRQEVARTLGHPDPASVDVERGFLDMGLDSLTALELRNQLSATTGIRLTSTAVFDYPTPAVLARHLLDKVTGRAAAPVISELDRLDSLLSSLSLENDSNADARARLLSFVRKWDSAGMPVSGSLQSATDEELFRALDGELGI